MEYFQKSVDLAVETGRSDKIASSLLNLGTAYIYLGNLAEARRLVTQGLELEQQRPRNDWMAALHQSLGDIEKRSTNYGQAKEHYDAAMNFAKKAGELYTQGLLHVNLSEIAEQRKERKQVKFHLDQAISLAQQSNSQDLLIQSTQKLAEYYEANSEFKDSALTYRNLNEMREKAFSENSLKQIATMQAAYDLGNKQKQIEILEKEQQLSALAKERSRWILWGLVSISALLLLMMILIYNRYQLKVASERKVLAINQKIQALLDNIPLGMVTVDSRLNIDPQYSRHLERILPKIQDDLQYGLGQMFERRFAIPSDQKDIMINAISASLGEDRIGFDMNMNGLPKA